MKRLVLIIFLWTSVVYGSLIPREVLFSPPDRAGVAVSPDGKYLSYLAPINGVLNLFIRTIGKEDDHPITNVKDRHVQAYAWVYNDNSVIYSRDFQGDENTQLFLVNIQTKEEKNLTPKGAKASILTLSSKLPDEVLVLINDRDPSLFDVCRINLKTFSNARVFENKDGYISVIADDDFLVRGLAKLDENGGMEIFLKASEKEGFKKFQSYNLEDADHFSFVSITSDGKDLYYIDAKDSNTSVLKKYSFNQKESQSIFSSKRADIEEVILDPKTKIPQACLVDYLKTHIMVLDREIKSDVTKLQNLQNGKEINIISQDEENQKWVVQVTSDETPISFYIYDRKSKDLKFLFSANRKLASYSLLPMKPILIKSRDGLLLPSYLTVPKDQKGPSTMILFVHGGPWARDLWGCSAYHQWLANRGYAVLSVNYRGSSGFGKDFLNAGNYQWSKKMHDDLIDACNWAIDKKIANPKKIGIMGGSYGGYATLVGLTFTPDFFALGVDIVGISHLKTFLESIPPYWKPLISSFNGRVGTLDDLKFLDEISPLTKVDQIKKPLLILQGRNDPRVKEAESEQIVAAMQKKGLPVTYVVFPDEGHGFAMPNNRIASIAIIEGFLAKYLGGKYEPLGNAIEKSSALIHVGKENIQ